MNSASSSTSASGADTLPPPRLGIDISKGTLDACLILPDLTVQRHRFSNDAQGFDQLQA